MKKLIFVSLLVNIAVLIPVCLGLITEAILGRGRLRANHSRTWNPALNLHRHLAHLSAVVAQPRS